MKRYTGKNFSGKKISEEKISTKGQVDFLVTQMKKFLLLSFVMMIIWSLDSKSVLGVQGSTVYTDAYATQAEPPIVAWDQASLNEDKTEIPMPITLTYFNVSEKIYEGQDAAHIEWTMSSEIGTSGFYILRSTTHYYDDAVVISGFIPCLGGIHSENISEYEYWDNRIISSKVVYAYWLQEVKTPGHTIYGPLYIGGDSRTVVDPPAGASQTNMKIYLPILMDW